jgi:hypothetical protein
MGPEEWQPCPGFPRYEVSSLGRVRRVVSVPYGKPPGRIRPWINHGYLAVTLSREGRRRANRYVHRLVAEAFLSLEGEAQVDHRFHDRADPAQIRVATAAENVRNQRGWEFHSSRYKGVSWSAKRATWYACISIDGRTRNLGCYADEADAARAYDRAAIAAWGAFAFLNFREFSAGPASRDPEASPAPAHEAVAVHKLKQQETAEIA